MVVRMLGSLGGQVMHVEPLVCGCSECVRWSPSERDCPMLTAALSPGGLGTWARTEVSGRGRGGKQRRAGGRWPPEAGGSRNPAARGQVQDLGGKMLAGWFSARPALLRQGTGAGVPAGPEGSASCTPLPGNSVCAWAGSGSPAGLADFWGPGVPSACIHQASWDFPRL